MNIRNHYCFKGKKIRQAPKIEIPAFVSLRVRVVRRCLFCPSIRPVEPFLLCLWEFIPELVKTARIACYAPVSALSVFSMRRTSCSSCFRATSCTSPYTSDTINSITEIGRPDALMTSHIPCLVSLMATLIGLFMPPPNLPNRQDRLTENKYRHNPPAQCRPISAR